MNLNQLDQPEEYSANVPEGEVLHIENPNESRQKYILDFKDYGTLVINLKPGEAMDLTVGKLAPEITIIDENVEH